ncbi:MAG: glycosyltransferase [Acidobacteria bacterium]|nr:glycosyltransferase [Acidobacteriota bacterium]MBI3662971.1 glycosyltransferase [Acidobacteriota bacterium]
MTTGIIWLGPVFDRGGYGAVSRNYLLGLQKLGVPVRVINNGEVHPDIDETTARELLKLRDADAGPEPAIVVHGLPTQFGEWEKHAPGRVARRIGCTIFETDRIPESWVGPCNQMDEIWVPSRFNLETFAASGVHREKLRVIPYGVDTDFFRPANPAIRPFRFDPEVKKFKFLYNFAFDYRKGADLLLDAFGQEFSANEDVALILKTYLPGWFNGNDSGAPRDLKTGLQHSFFERATRAREDLPQVIVIDRLCNARELAGLYWGCDAYISTDRANGWGMPCLEMMALGKPAATIDWSGSTEFMNQENSFLIRPTGRLVPVDERLQRIRPIYQGHQWAEVTVEEVRRVLRSMYENHVLREQVGARAYADVKAHYILERAAGHIVDTLQCPQGKTFASSGVRTGSPSQTRGVASAAPPDGPYLRGIHLFLEGRLIEALPLLGEALREEETSERWNDWATAQLACERMSEAEQGYRRALELDAQNVQAAANLGILLAGLQRNAEAVPFLEQSAFAADEQQRGVLLRLLAECKEQAASPPGQSAPAKANTTASVPANDSARPAQSRAPARAPDKSAGGKNPVRTNNQAPDPKATAEAKTASSRKQRTRPGILYRAVVYGGSGYAEGNLGILAALARHQVPVQLMPVGHMSDHKKLLSPNTRETLLRMEQNHLNIFKSIFYQSAPASDFELFVRGRYQVGHTFFETDGVPEGWRDRLQAMDEVWVRSTFNRETFIRAGVDERRIRVIPEGVDTSVYRPGIRPLKIPKARGFNFLSVFDWHYRKAPEVLLRAYMTEFKADEDVALILKIYTINDPYSDPEAKIAHFVERELGETLDHTPPVILLDGFIRNEDMPRLFAASNALVIPSRGEGWGRPYMEAMACERPVIATRWSAQIDFLNDENSFLIEPEAIVSTPQDIDVESMAGHRWAEPSVEHLRKLMRQVFSRREEAQKRAAQARRDAIEKWDWKVVGPQWVTEFQRLLS